MLLKIAKDTIRSYNLIKQRDKILLGVSGGPDSLALLYLLHSLKEEFKLSLHVAHLDHMLRGDSGRDADFVRRAALNLKVPFTMARVNVKEMSERGSVEEIARNARLGFLFRIARQIKANKIALGHNRDDQAETVLMRILRGSGLYGLSGISPKRNICGFEIIRPLIEVKRKEIEAFLKRKNLTPVKDPTNRDDSYFRNKIRLRLLPLLEKEYNKNISQILVNMSKSLADDYDYLSEEARKTGLFMKSSLNLGKLKKMHPAIQRIILRSAIAKVKGDMRRLSFKHIQELEGLIYIRPFNSIVDLPKGISVIKKKQSLCFYRR